MRARTLAIALVLLSPALSFSPLRGETQSNPAVTVVADISDLSNVDRVIFSPDGQQVATVGGASGVQVWEASSGRLLRTLKYEAYFNAVVFSPDGKSLISGQRDGNLKLWNLATGAVAASLQSKPKPAPGDDVDPVFSLWVDAKAGLLVTGSQAGIITVWNLEKREQQRSFKFGKVPAGVNSHIIAVRLTADQARVIAVTYTSVKVFDVSTGKELTAYDLPDKSSIWDGKGRNFFSADSIVSDDGLIVQHTAPDCLVEELRFLSLRNTSELVTVDKPESCARSDDNTSFGQPSLFTSSTQPTVIIARSGVAELKQWDLQTGSLVRTIKWADATEPGLVGLDHNFKLAASLKSDSVVIREFENGTKVRELKGSVYPVESVAVSRDGRSMLLAHDTSRGEHQQKDITLWQVGSTSLKSIQLATDADSTIGDFAPEAKLAAAANSKGEIILFSTETGSELRRFSISGVTGVSKLRLSPDGKLAALVGADADNAVLAALVTVADGTVKQRFAGRDERNGVMASTGPKDESDFVTAVAFSPDGRNLAVGHWNGTAEIWDAQKVWRIKSLPASRDNGDQIWSLAFTTDGRKLVAGSRDSGVFLWDIAAGRPPRSFLYEGLAGHVHVASVAVSHDGATVAGGLSEHAVSSGDTGPEHGIKVWNAATGKLRFTLRGHQGGVGGLTFSSDDRWIVSASFDGTIRYWNSETGRWVATFTMAKDGRWAVLTEGGVFAGTDGSDDFINVVRGLRSLPALQFRSQLYRPDLVEALLKGDPDRRYSSAVQQLNLEKIWQSGATP
jgi:WD40 repeat protein